MRISDWSSDVCSSDLLLLRRRRGGEAGRGLRAPQPVRPRAREPRHLPLAPAGGAAVAQRRKARALSPPTQPPCSGLTPRIRGYRSIYCPLTRLKAAGAGGSAACIAAQAVAIPAARRTLFSTMAILASRLAPWFSASRSGTRTGRREDDG